MKKPWARGGLLAAVVLVGGALYGLSGRETSRELVEHERSEYIPIRQLQKDGIYIINPPDTRGWEGRIPWAERRVYRINRFLARPFYEVVVEQDSGVVILEPSEFDESVMTPTFRFTGPNRGEGRHVTSNPDEFAFRNLFNSRDPGYRKIK